MPSGEWFLYAPDVFVAEVLMMRCLIAKSQDDDIYLFL
jgi:hypothetical protein